MRRYLKSALTPRHRRRLRSLASILFANDLNRVATICATDKWNTHWYTQHYQRHFQHLRWRRLNVLEIGAGGYEDPESGGESLRMWKRYFPRSSIYSIDIYDKSALEEDRIRIFQGSQADEAFLRHVAGEIGSLDIVIDDGSHITEHVIRSFEVLFPFLNDGGVYAVEDVQTSYWPEAGGDSDDFDNPRTTMGFFKRLVDGLNYEEFEKPGYTPSYYDRTIVAIHFYHNLVLVHKGRNEEGTTRDMSAARRNDMTRETLP